MPSHIGKALHPQKAPNFPFLIVISSLQLGHKGALIFELECLEQTGTPVEFNLTAKLLHLTHFIKIKKQKKRRKII